jgi:hypothetical protein
MGLLTDTLSQGSACLEHFVRRYSYARRESVFRAKGRHPGFEDGIVVQQIEGI